MDTLYNEEFKKIMQVNRNCTSMAANRVDEIMNFARAAGLQKIGIAHCITFSHEAALLDKYLSRLFDVFTVDCKYGRVRQKDLLGGNSNFIVCNPVGQAEYLNEQCTELNISMGLCVGHDIIFSKKSEGWVTNLFDKDFTNNNNPGVALAEIESKLRK